VIITQLEDYNSLLPLFLCLAIANKYHSLARSIITIIIIHNTSLGVPYDRRRDGNGIPSQRVVMRPRGFSTTPSTPPGPIKYFRKDDSKSLTTIILSGRGVRGEKRECRISWLEGR